jgi:hypothetical protein
MATPLSISRDINGFQTTGSESCRKFSDLAQFFTLTASTVKTVTVPLNNSSKMMAHFTFSSDTTPANVWVLPAASPVLALPTGTVTLTTAELNPGQREVVGGQVLQLLTGQAGISVSITYYAIP